MKPTPHGRLLLIPTPLQQPEECQQPWLLESDRQQVSALTDFLVETPKAARRWLGLLGMQQPIRDLQLRALPGKPEGKAPRLDARDWWRQHISWASRSCHWWAPHRCCWG